MVPIDYLDSAVGLNADRCAVIDGDLQLSFRALADASRALARVIARHRRGSDPVPVAMYSPNDHRVLIAMLAIMRAGGVIVPVHPENSLPTTRDFVQRIEPPSCVSMA